MYRYSEAINLLINKFPILKAIYEDNIYDYQDLPYVFYESIFVKYIIERIQSHNEAELRDIFIFIEELLLKGDAEFRNLLDVAVIESLYFENNFSEYNVFLLKFYGDLTKKSLDMLASQDG